MKNPRVYQLDSPSLDRKRKLAVWVPPQYEQNPDRHFPVLYMHDGQLVFTSREDELPYGSWGVDEWIVKLINDGIIDPVIVVGVYNSAQRMKEYFPITDNYRRYREFFRSELIPWVAEQYRVLDGPNNRALMGSSMGGLVSFALAVDDPELYGAAACLSPWFEYDSNTYIHDVLRPMKGKPEVRVYLDSGILDWRGLDDGHRGMLMARQELLRLGFEEGKDLDWFVDTWFPTEDDLKGTPVKPDKISHALVNQHNEFQWRRRLERPLRFLFE